MRGAGGIEGGDGGGGGGGGPPSGPAGGIDIAGTYPNAIEVVGLRGVEISATAPVLNQVLAFDGTRWTPTSTLVDVALTGNAGPVQIQSTTDVNITATGGLVGQFGDAISLNTTNGPAELSGTGTATLASVSANVSISANNGIALNTTTGIVSVPNRPAGDSGMAAANTGFVAAAVLPAYYTSALVGPTVSGTAPQTYINVSPGPTLAAGTYEVEWSVVSTHTASGSVLGAQLTLAGATQVPTSFIDGSAAGSAGARTSLAPRGFYTHAGGPLSLLLQVRRSSGTGNVIPQYGTIIMRKVA